MRYIAPDAIWPERPSELTTCTASVVLTTGLALSVLADPSLEYRSNVTEVQNRISGRLYAHNRDCIIMHAIIQTARRSDRAPQIPIKPPATPAQTRQELVPAVLADFIEKLPLGRELPDEQGQPTSMVISVSLWGILGFSSSPSTIRPNARSEVAPTHPSDT